VSPKCYNETLIAAAATPEQRQRIEQLCELRSALWKAGDRDWQKNSQRTESDVRGFAGFPGTRKTGVPRRRLACNRLASEGCQILEQRVELPDDVPWYWSAAELESFIAQRKDQW